MRSSKSEVYLSERIEECFSDRSPFAREPRSEPSQGFIAKFRKDWETFKVTLRKVAAVKRVFNAIEYDMLCSQVQISLINEANRIFCRFVRRMRLFAALRLAGFDMQSQAERAIVKLAEDLEPIAPESL